MRRPRLTKTQTFILRTACANPAGLVKFGRGDRKGTRVAGRDQLDIPITVAFGVPEYFLVVRRLLERYGNEPHQYRITLAGRVAIADTVEARDA